MALASDEQRTTDSPWAIAPIPSDVPSSPRMPGLADILDESSHVVGAPAPRGMLTPRALEPPPHAADFVWIAAHGGAGVSSLASVSGRGLALSQRWPSPELGWPSSAVVVCRSNAAGYTAASRLLQEWASGSVLDVEVVALVVVADSPSKPTRALKARLHELSGAVAQVLTVPWIATWRDTPYSADPAVSRVAAAVAALITKEEKP